MATSEQPNPLVGKEFSQGTLTVVHNEDAKDAEHHGVSHDWSEKEERALVWMVDLRVFPMLCTLFGVSVLDRTNISAAYIAGMNEDIALAEGPRYSISLLVFFIGYVIFEIPSNMMIRRLGTRIWMTLLIVIWGSLVLAMGFVHHWVSLTVLRALLGIFEAGLYPGAVFVITSWYKKFEMAKRISFFYMSALLASGFGPIFAYALSLIRVGDSTYRQGWRWIFIVEGIFTIVLAVAVPFTLVEFPEKARFLNDRERHIATERLLEGQSREEIKHPGITEVLKMLVDWKLLIYCFPYYVCGSSIYAMSYFAPIILRQGMGFSYTLAQVLSGMPYLFTMAASMATAWASDRIKMRWPVMCAQYLVAVAGLLIMLYGEVPAFRYFGLFIAVFGSQANGPQLLAYAQNQTPTMAKRGILPAIMIAVGGMGGITGSTIFRSQDAPDYLPGMWTTIAFQLASCMIIFVASMHFRRQNRLLEQGKVAMLEGVPGFKYVP
ncbi:putative transporter [Cyphellophora attinorum]|uniref:Putative transporter n=1 Tax=Cyphellophora attinorum TaxID=1664694 RepID=A0A0N0NQQ6_9EURO|nr:putative transporter [Phialophora attinorum]KPI44191.1 putative transporter [Phialophora attinorum]